MGLRALGVYIYGGGFYYGMKKAGYDVVAHLEDGPIVNTTVFNHNSPEVLIRYAPDWGLETYRNNVDVVFCNPPCAIWSPIGISVSRGRDAYKTDPRLECWENCIKVGLAVQPKALLVETVPRGYTLGLPFLKEKARQMQEAGYSVTIFLHSIRWMGSPQNRQRLFFIATKGFKWEPLEGPWDESVTVGKVLDAVTEEGEPYWPMPKGWVDIYNQIAVDQKKPSFRDLCLAAGLKNKPSFMNYRLPYNGHMGAFTGGHFLHPLQPRSLTMPEMRALCGYPETYSFPDHRSWKCCGSVFAQAVMPAAGDYIGRSVAAAIEKNEPNHHGVEVMTVYDWRKTRNEPDHLGEDIKEA